MRERILTGWTFIRATYLIIGLLIIGQAWTEGQWAGVMLGGYFAAMGIFRFGCASGACYTVSDKIGEARWQQADQTIDFEEVKK